MTLWLICSVINYGLAYAYMQGEYGEMARRVGLDYRSEDRVFAAAIACSGPLGILPAIVCSRFAKHGIKFL